MCFYGVRPLTLTLGWVVLGRQRRIRVLPTPEGLTQSEHGLWDQATWAQIPRTRYVCDPEQFTWPLCASVSSSIKWERNSTCLWLFRAVSKRETMLSCTRELRAAAQPAPWGVAHLWDRFLSDSNTGRGTQEVPHEW